MNRRQFIGSAALATITASVGNLQLLAASNSDQIRWAMGWILWRNYNKREISLQEAVQELRELGMDGIEFTPRPDELSKHGFSPESFRDLLKDNKISVSGHYFGGSFHDPNSKKAIMTSFQERLDSLKFYGAKNIIIGPPKSQAGAKSAESIRKLAPVINELGRIARDQGVAIGIHPHYNCIIETPAEIHLAMELTDPKYVGLAPDTGHIALGGGHVLEILHTYKNRLNYFHFKDVAGQVKRPNFKSNLRELGKGEIDFPAIMALLKEVKYKGWINVEQDATQLTPRESAALSGAYIKQKLI